MIAGLRWRCRVKVYAAAWLCRIVSESWRTPAEDCVLAGCNLLIYNPTSGVVQQRTGTQRGCDGWDDVNQ